MRIELGVTDEISPAILRVIRNKDGYLRHVSKSVGWWFQRETKQEIRKSGSAGGVAFKKRTSYEYVRKRLDIHAPKAWYGRMLRAFGYEYENGGVNIGWTSPTSASLGNILEYGATRQITEKLRRKYLAAKVKLGNKKQIKLPARPIFEPKSSEMRDKIPSYVEEKVQKYMTENVEFGKRNRRKYKVYKA